ncbi:recombinase family protein [Nocardia sp. NPDC060259]|uniref:recombinase family protein n=1 Tax=Nocardia sp. NPDC060259 TaxID=3347088 RepID=UPI003652A0B4
MTNPRYTGYEVWNKQRKQESLIDVEDVALGHETRLAWNIKDQWVFSDQLAHEPLIDRPTFEQAQLLLTSRGQTTSRVTSRRKHGYMFKGLIFHETCGRRMQGNWNHDRLHYRCRYPSEYAIANKIDHSPTAYLREGQIVGPLDHWLAQTFAPERIEHSLATLAEAQPPNNPEVEATRRVLTEQNRKLGTHRQALEAGPIRSS